MNSEELFHLLSNEDLEIEGRLVDASNATLLAKIGEGDSAFPVIYKPIAGERPLWDFPSGNLASREVAAYIVSNKAGFNLVPMTIFRDGPFGPGAVQLWIDVDPEIDVISVVQSGDVRLRDMTLFDAIVNNTDRKFGHILISPDGEVFGCDHGVTFHEEDKLRTVLWNWAGADLLPEEIAKLEKIDSELDSWELDLLLSPSEIKALKGRVSRLLQNQKFPEPSENWPAVPWPPY